MRGQGNAIQDCPHITTYKSIFYLYVYANANIAVNVKITLFWDLTSCNLIVGTNVLEEPTASIFYPEGGGSEFLRNADTAVLNYKVSRHQKPGILSYRRITNAHGLCGTSV